jgi:hypothetical protein
MAELPPYHPLSRAQVEVARALSASRHWQWPDTLALEPRGAVLEVRRGQQLKGQEVPYLPHPGVAGHLLDMLDTACGSTVRWSVGRGEGPACWCILEARGHRRVFTGTCMGEASGRALLARWRRLGG